MTTTKNIKPPKQLYTYFEQYKKYTKKNSKKEYMFIPSMKKEIGVTREIPYTWNGFDIWLRKNKIIAKLEDYKANRDDRYSDYVDIIHAIGVEIYEDKYVGATAGVFNANIIARDLGLSDKTDNTNTNTIKFKNVSKQFPEK